MSGKSNNNRPKLKINCFRCVAATMTVACISVAEWFYVENIPCRRVAFRWAEINVKLLSIFFSPRGTWSSLLGGGRCSFHSSTGFYWRICCYQTYLILKAEVLCNCCLSFSRWWCIFGNGFLLSAATRSHLRCRIGLPFAVVFGVCNSIRDRVKQN